MAQMERVTNIKFAESLERNRTALNSAFDYFSSGDSSSDPEDVLNIFTGLLNPLFDEGLNVTDKTVISVFKSLLKLKSKGLIGKNGRFKNLERHLYSIAACHKRLLSEHGGLFMINIFNALLNLYGKNITSIEKWVSILSTIDPDIEFDTFRKAGFILAWRCGAASGRESAAELIRTLDHKILNAVFEMKNIDNSAVKQLHKIITNEPWRDPADFSIDNSAVPPVFRTAGGFSGYGREFRSLPAAAVIDDCIYATDGLDVFKLHADYYGSELIRDNEVKPESIRPGGVVNRFVKDGSFIINNKSYPLPSGWKTGITSIAVSRNIIVWTLRDSYKLYIAGISPLK
ncbi:MAG: hypothetical protein CVV49_14775 [Spirochaetae bacterium HGW-Spirochaetae-5]|nr:MAG: hypothetical protein CVV49_14775 [Spirochaetae bacterium HGW-Spirochaetae-5]